MFHYFRKKKLSSVLESIFNGTYDPYVDNVVFHMDMDSSLTQDKYGRVGTLVGTVASDTGKFGNAAKFTTASSFIRFSPSSDFVLGKTFTIECWINTSGSGGECAIVSCWDMAFNGWMLAYSTAGQFNFYDKHVTKFGIAYTLTQNQWYHVAVSCNNGSARLYINGSPIGSAFNPQCDGATTDPLTIGNNAQMGGNRSFFGLIDEVRITRGVSRYNSSFDVPTAPFPVGLNISYDYLWDSTTLELLGSNDGKFDRTFVDSSSNNHSVVPVNSNVLQAFYSPYESGSIHFDGAGDYLQSVETTALELASNDFTIEMYVRLSAAGSNRMVVGGYGSGSGTWTIYQTENTLQFFASSNGASWDIVSANIGMCEVGKWYHVAVTRSGNVFRIFHEGNLVTTHNSSAPIAVSGNGVTLGGRAGGAGSEFFHGNIANFRMVVGSALYTASFPTPSAMLPFVAGTKLLLGQRTSRFSEYGNVTAYGDVRPNNLSPYTSYDRGGCLLLQNTSPSQINLPASTINTLTGDFTLELWVHPLIVATSQTHSWLWAQNGSSFAAQNLWLGTHAGQSGKVSFMLGSYSTSNVMLVDPTPVNTTKYMRWTHYAVVKHGTTYTMYRDGAAVATQTFVGTAMGPNSNTVAIGYNQANSVSTMYMSDIRFSNIARYTGTFSAPTTEFVDDVNTTLLMNCNHGMMFNQNVYPNMAPTLTAGPTAYGRTFVGALSPYADKSAGSVYFGNGADYLNVNNTSINSFYTSDFTIEFWMYRTSTPLTTEWWLSHGTAGGILIGYENDTWWGVASHSNGWQLKTNAPISLHQWHHIAFVRKSGNMAIYLNGANVAYATGITTNYTGCAFNINNGAVANHFVGMMADFHIAKYAKYSTNFTAPNTRIKSVPNTTLLLNFGVNSAVRDEKQAAYIGGLGTVSHNGTIKRNGSASMYFNGSSALRVRAESRFVFGTSDFTTEMWINPTSFASSYRAFYANTAQNGFAILLSSTGTISFGRALVGVDGTTSNAVVFGQWNHIAISRSSGVLKVFINGIQGYSGANSINYLGAGDLTIGIDGDMSSFPYIGYIDDLRITSFARYLRNFSTPTQELTPRLPTSEERSAAVYDPFWQQVVLSLSFDGADNSTAFVEHTGKTVTAYGSAAIKTDIKKFGSGSLGNNGAGAAWSSVRATMSDINFVSNDWTIEAWAYRSTNGFQAIAGQTTADGDGNWFFYVYGSGQVAIGRNGVNEFKSATGIVPANEWYHVAAVKVGNTIRLYVNGQFAVETLNASNYINTTANPFCVYSTGLDDVRVTKSIARYTGGWTAGGNYVPNTEAFPKFGASY